mmetsp:Transcript_6607/g.16882  ORF Transcript_6607/g.16882 Transcript_6607/m.16882 type:complete len:271 (-) Transcript_6607:1597-2409(-)
MFPLGYIKSSYHAFKHAAVGIRDVISGQSWRRSLLDEAADAYVDSVWCEGDESLGERDKHFFQVGATFAGRRITDQQHDELCNSVVRGLQITNTDVVVDVCCGNGIVTDVLAQHASTVIGVDFSSRLLEIAKAHYMQQNVSYIQMDLSKPELARFAKFPPVTKVCFHSALQYFTVEDLREILLFLKTLSRGEPLKVKSLFFLLLRSEKSVWNHYVPCRFSSAQSPSVRASLFSTKLLEIASHSSDGGSKEKLMLLDHGGIVLCYTPWRLI